MVEGGRGPRRGEARNEPFFMGDVSVLSSDSFFSIYQRDLLIVRIKAG